MKSILDMTQDEITSLPEIDYDGVNFDSLVIVPTHKMHGDSHFMTMYFVLLLKDKILGIVYTASDCINLSTILSNELYAWKIDCLPISGYIRIHCHCLLMLDGVISKTNLIRKKYNHAIFKHPIHQNT